MVSTLTPQSDQDAKQTQEQSPSAAELQQQFDMPAFDPESGKEKPSFLDGIKNSVRSKVDRVMGVFSPIPRTYHKVANISSSIGQGIKRIVNFFTGNSSENTQTQENGSVPEEEIKQEQTPAFSEKPEEIRKAYQAAEAAEQDHMDDLADRFALLQNNYRRQLKHENADLKMKSPVLNANPSLMKEAAIIAEKQAAQGILAHTSDEYRLERGIHGENLFSGGGVDFPYEALKGFLASEKHKPSVMGSFTEVGYAIRAGIDEESGKKIYFLVVLYGNGTPQNAQNIEIPDQERQLKELKAKNLEEAVKDRPYLKVHFDALQREIKNDPELSLEFNTELTAQMQKKLSKNGKENPLKGMFSISLKKGDKVQNYSVYDRPPLLIRSEKTADGDRSFQVEFHDVLQDFENMSNAPEMTTEEMEEAAVDKSEITEEQSIETHEGEMINNE